MTLIAPKPTDTDTDPGGPLLTRSTAPDLSTLEGIETRHVALVAEANEILTAAGDVDLEGDDLTRYGEIEDEMGRLKTRKDRLERLARAAQSGGMSGDGATGPGGSGPYLNRNADPFDISDRRLVGDEVRARALTAVERTTHLDDAYKARATALLETIDQVDGRLARHVVVTGRPAYRSGFQKLIAGANWAITAEEQAAILEAHAASLADPDGGHAVPYTLDVGLILTSDSSTNPFRSIARQVTTLTDYWRGVTTTGASATYYGEGVEVGDDTPTLEQPSIQVHKASIFVPYSIEIGQDWVGLESELRMVFADARDDNEARVFTVGTGVGQPTGIVTALTGSPSEIPSAATDTFAPADVYTTQESVPTRYRSRGSWLANLGAINLVRQFGTATQSHAFTVDLTAGSPPQLLGRPLHETSYMDGEINTGQHNRVLIFGDFRHYVVVDRVGMSVETVAHLMGPNGRPTGQRGLYVWWRHGADSVNDNAFRMLNVT